ncbi:MAG: hypothetical protein EB100_07380, partial [Crocinitomicaceae bacterium]|nr:hypothetical protein [Crocinitomicaceae bacterium]
ALAQSICLNGSASSLTSSLNGGTGLTFQWYSNTTSSNTGGTLIANATSGSYTPPTNQVGTTYYYVVVTNSAGCVSPSTVSGAITINALPSVSLSNSANTVTYDANSQTTTISYINSTGNPTTYSITWNANPSNSFSTVTNANLSSSPININVPAGANTGTYTGILTVNNASNCTSSNNSFTVTINSNDFTAPSITFPISQNNNGSSSLKISENTSSVTTFTANEPVTWSITGGSESGLFSINSTDLVVERNGIRDITGNPNLKTVADVRWFTSNKIYSGQFNGDHYFPKPKIKLTWSGFYSNINREIPNLRRNIYSIDTSNPLQIPIASIATTSSGGADYGGGMFFSENKETIEGAKIDISKKFTIGEEFINEFKIGAFVQKRDRDFFARQLQYKTLNFGGVFDNNLLNLPNETIFSPENMGQVAPGLNGFTLFDATKVTDAYKAGSKLYAGYAMLDNRYKKFRLVWGARIENYIQTLD